MSVKAFLHSVLIALLLVVSIATSSEASTALYSSKGIPLTSVDFKEPISKEMIKKNANSSLSEENFELKWKNSLQSPILFLRSYPYIYHIDLTQIPTTSIPGSEGMCLGDAHPDNFGFLHLDNKTLFGYNDLDDSGYCPIAYDALRFFTAIQLWNNGRNLTTDELEENCELAKDVLKKYVDVVIAVAKQVRTQLV